MENPTDIEILTQRDAAMFDRLASNPTWRVRAHVAGNQCATPDTLARLAGDPSAAVRAAVAHNPNTAASILTRLTADLDPEVREEALGHAATPAEALVGAVHGGTELDAPPLTVVARWVRSTRQPVLVELAVWCLAADDIEATGSTMSPHAPHTTIAGIVEG